MKIICEKNYLKDAVMHTERVTGKNLSLPILNSILLSIKKKTLSLRATNLDIGIEIDIPATIEEEGVIAVPGSILGAFITNTYKNTPITIQEKNGNIEVSADGNITIIKCYPPEEFPTLPIITEGEHITFNAIKLTEGIKSVIYSASISDIKPELASIYIYPENDGWVFVATDSFRLAEKKVFNKNTKIVSGILIPQKNAAEIARLFENKPGDIDIRFNKNQISLSQDGIYFTSRLIDGIFPDYKQIIPKEKKTEAILLKQDFINALKLSAVFSNKQNRVTVKILPAQKKMFIEAKNQETGESNASIDAAISGEDVELDLNARYVNDCLSSIHQDSVSISCDGANKPVIIQGVGDNSFTYLVMPMNK